MFQQRSINHKKSNFTGFQVFKWIIHGNLLMGICGFAWAVSAYLMVAGSWEQVNWVWATALTLGIVGVYNGARVYLLKRAGPLPEALTENQAWSLSHYRSLMGLTIFCLLLAFLLLWFIKWEIWGILALAGMLLAAYYWSALLPKHKGLRNYGWLKNLVIGLVWAILTVTPPLLDQQAPIFTAENLWLIGERTLFIYLLMIPFDIKDIDADQKAGVKTIPSVIGIPKSKWLLGGLILLLGGVYALHYNDGLLLAHECSLGYLLMLLLFLHPTRSSTHFLLFWDGAILLQGILVMGLLKG